MTTKVIRRCQTHLPTSHKQSYLKDRPNRNMASLINDCKGIKAKLQVIWTNQCNFTICGTSLFLILVNLAVEPGIVVNHLTSRSWLQIITDLICYWMIAVHLALRHLVTKLLVQLIKMLDQWLSWVRSSSISKSSVSLSIQNLIHSGIIYKLQG